MEKSEEIFKELEGLESTRNGIEKRWVLSNNSLSLHQLVHELLIKQVTGPSEEVERLQKEIKEKLKARDVEKDEYLLELKTLRNQLQLLTSPVILDCIREISDEIFRVRKKRISEIVDRKYSGLQKTTFLKVRSNDAAIQEAQALGKGATSKFQEMRYCSISMIEAEVKKLLDAIRNVDISKFDIVEKDEAAYFKGKAPEGIGPGTANYDGPLSGLRK
jgi:hypothetical protein